MADRAETAGEADARAALVPFPARHHDAADAAGPRDVRSAARREIPLLDVHQPQRAPALRLLSQRQRRRLFGARVAHADRPVLVDDAIGFVLGTCDRVGLEHRGEVDGRDVSAQVKADRRGGAGVNERSRQDMLAAVLLDVVEPPLLIDLS